MAKMKSTLLLNRSNEPVESKNDEPRRLWRKFEINERTCILFLVMLSLSIVLGKLYINYGNILQQNSSKYIVLPTSVFSNVTNIFDLSHIPDVSELNVKQLAAVSKKFVNISQYDDVVVNVMTSFKTYGWLMRAAICGFLMMGFTWFIIYKDSSIPGINPPSPFSPSKQQFPKATRVQINYLIGILNGILLFIYMCL
ncbi:uncharacterized protein LOC143180005 [Calliopsis andreniformis]|uniref:uncharacterized protein LOC143180005 n=1 Tax=Calliopsis andreniformis TaxID=337506 RepID=UPI003FCCC0CA